MRETGEPSTDQFRKHGAVTLEARLDKLESTLEDIRKVLVAGTTTFATVEQRLAMIERIVYGGCAIGLLGIGGAILALVIKQGSTL
ncbi:MAG: hypothetical protein H0W48_00475 [Methylibium sp.]|nr:hypothetical protein [Methylibium sp.]